VRTVNVSGAGIKARFSLIIAPQHASGALVPSSSLVPSTPSSSLKCRFSLRSRPCCSSRALLLRRLSTRSAPTTHYGTGYENHNFCLSSDLFLTTDGACASRPTTRSIKIPVKSLHICNLHAGRVVSFPLPPRGRSIIIYHIISGSIYRSSPPIGIRVLRPDSS